MKLARAQSHFALKLLKELSSEKPESNTFFSPTSISVALAMAYAGARGKSEAELSTAFGHTAAGLFSRESILESYKQILAKQQTDDNKLGVRSIFSDADLSGITDDGGLQVTDVQHKAAIEVNEEGTVAAGATVVILERNVFFSTSARRLPAVCYFWEKCTNSQPLSPPLVSAILTQQMAMGAAPLHLFSCKGAAAYSMIPHLLDMWSGQSVKIVLI
ncbi:hypothetical protein HPB47_006235 [Ixodes persulcatus]|uniref:Uncharacterized protein n=1 Tax=Ixodes persulcatus TaxID=34615 RepID=A0AC60PAZ6_IXOPE|nr:hypothetical protein HPB47_006235 [Ixodes persulcatus]